MKKQWAGALFSVKCCCLCDNHRERVSNFELARLKKKKRKKERKTFWPSGNFLVQYFHDAISHQCVCCLS